MIQFYLPEVNSYPVLPTVESGHCVRVLRMREGDEVMCVDGKGQRYRCRIIDPHPKHVALQVIESEHVPKNWECNISLAIAPTKNLDRMEWMAEKCTEMGIDDIWPVRCAHSERKELKIERIEKILVSAMKQSLKTHLPNLSEIKPLKELLKQDVKGQKFICYCADDVPRREFCKEYIPGSDVAILIGPEGDFSPEEVDMALHYGWIPVSLGHSRLRTESAAVFAVASVHSINQRLI